MDNENWHFFREHCLNYALCANVPSKKPKTEEVPYWIPESTSDYNNINTNNKIKL